METQTHTEQEKILNLLFDGYNKKQIAELLNISIYKLNKRLEEYSKE